MRLALAALALPAFFVVGFSLCYVSAYQAPVPHGVPVAVAGPAAQTAPLRDGLVRAVGPAFDVEAGVHVRMRRCFGVQQRRACRAEQGDLYAAMPASRCQRDM